MSFQARRENEQCKISIQICTTILVTLLCEDFKEPEGHIATKWLGGRESGQFGLCLKIRQPEPPSDPTSAEQRTKNWKKEKINWKQYKFKFNFWYNKNFQNCFIFLSAFYLTTYLMKSPKNFEKITILKIWELFSFWGVKTHFGEKKA